MKLSSSVCKLNVKWFEHFKNVWISTILIINNLFLTQANYRSISCIKVINLYNYGHDVKTIYKLYISLIKNVFLHERIRQNVTEYSGWRYLSKRYFHYFKI